MSTASTPRSLPSNIKLLSPRGTVTPAATPSARPVPAAPDWLDAAARDEWERLAPSIAATYRPEFESSFAAFCVLYARFKANPDSFGAPRLAQLRAYQNALALNPKAHRVVIDTLGKR